MDNTNEKYAAGLLPFHPVVLLRDVLKRGLLIVLAALIAGVGTYIYADMSYEPLYRSTTTFVVSNQGTSSTVYSNLSTTTSLAGVFSELLNSSVMRKSILQQLGTSGFSGSISASAVPETNLITVTVTASDPRTAFVVSQAIVEHHEVVTYQVVDNVVLDVLQQPQVAGSPINSVNAGAMMKKTMLYAAVAAAALLAVQSYQRDTVRSGKEAKTKLDCSFLGDIPHEKKYKTLATWLRHKKTSILITNPVTGFRFTETIRKLRRRVEQRMRGSKVLMVTSLLENEGKSTVAVNLALALAQKHKRVLLIDCDLRKPSCHILMEERGVVYGVRDVLSGQVAIPDAIVQDKKSKLFMLLEKRGSADSGAYIASAEMKALLEWARTEYDYVVLDLPPMSEVSDAESMTACADASLLVVRQNTANTVALNKAVAVLNDGKAKMLGCVLNDVASAALEAGRGYGYGYGYGKYGRYGYGHYGHYGNYSNKS